MDKSAEPVASGPILKVLVADSKEDFDVSPHVYNRSNVFEKMLHDVDIRVDDNKYDIVLKLDMTREQLEAIVAFYTLHAAGRTEKELEGIDKTMGEQAHTKPSARQFGSLPAADKKHVDYFAQMSLQKINGLNSVTNQYDFPAMLLSGCMMIAMRTQSLTPDEVRKEFGLPPQTKEEYDKSVKQVLLLHPWLKSS
jgi:hypothetical protein